tara:strand:- start:1040 stop:1360 length:321 start_codon:yes stop_codon:yes gene_type:complete
MSSSKHLLEATFNRINERLNKILVNGAEKATIISQEWPEKIRKELELLQEEIIEEAIRLEKNNSKEEEEEEKTRSEEANQSNNPSTIKRIREKISATAILIEDKIN